MQYSRGEEKNSFDGSLRIGHSSTGGVERWCETVPCQGNCQGRPIITVYEILRNILHCYPYKICHVQELFLSDLPARQTSFRISSSHGQRMSVENFVDRRSPFTSDRICQHTEFPNMGNRKSIRSSTCITSSWCGADLWHHLS